MTDKAVDLSNWDADITPETILCFLVNGYTSAIIGCQVEDTANKQAAICINGGMVTKTTYAFLYFGFDGFMGIQDLIALETNKAIRVALAHGMTHVALDCEANGANARDGVTADERVADWRRARDMVIAAGLRPVVYSGSFYWRDYMGNVAFDDPLWLANYGAANGIQPPPEPMLLVPMGGAVHEVNVHQYSSLPDLCGRSSRDRNYVNTPWWDEDDMTEDEIRAIVRDELNRGLRQDDPVTPALVGPESVPALVAQVVGPDAPTYTDPDALATIARVQNHLASPGGAHAHTPAQIPHNHGAAQ